MKWRRYRSRDTVMARLAANYDIIHDYDGGVVNDPGEYYYVDKGFGASALLKAEFERRYEEVQEEEVVGKEASVGAQELLVDYEHIRGRVHEDSTALEILKLSKEFNETLGWQAKARKGEVDVV